jgi:hypothetical protein
MERRAERLGPALLIALLVASLALTVYVFRARTPDLALEVIRFQGELSPNGDGEKDLARVTFFVRFDEPDATIQIVAKNAVPIRTLADDYELSEGQYIRCTWDGHTDDGDIAPVGRYRLRVVAPSQDRDMVFPKRVDIRGVTPDSEAPEVPPNCLPVEPVS